jgi:hypothetical protein
LKTTNLNDQQRCVLQTDKNMNATAIEAMSTEHHHIESVVKSMQDAATGLENGRRLNLPRTLFSERRPLIFVWAGQQRALLAPAP